MYTQEQYSLEERHEARDYDYDISTCNSNNDNTMCYTNTMCYFYYEYYHD